MDRNITKHLIKKKKSQVQHLAIVMKVSDYTGKGSGTVPFNSPGGSTLRG